VSTSTSGSGVHASGEVEHSGWKVEVRKSETSAVALGEAGDRGSEEGVGGDDGGDARCANWDPDDEASCKTQETCWKVIFPCLTKHVIRELVTIADSAGPSDCLVGTKSSKDLSVGVLEASLAWESLDSLDSDETVDALSSSLNSASSAMSILQCEFSANWTQRFRRFCSGRSSDSAFRFDPPETSTACRESTSLGFISINDITIDCSGGDLGGLVYLH